jgi:hypothetical protein
MRGGEKMKLKNLNLVQLRFAQAGVTANVAAWKQLEQQLSVEDQINCVLALAKEPEPQPILRRLIVSKNREQVAQRRQNHQ